jgi:CRISPR-associated protein Cmr2
MRNKTLLGISIGPVQLFINSARTVRDLWSGSYILSWLTAHAASSVIDSGGEMIFPPIENNPLYLAIKNGSTCKEEALQSCLPNTFIAEVPSDKAKSIADGCKRAVLDEWLRISNCVKLHLGQAWDKKFPVWDYDWKGQIKHFWDIRISLLPPVSDEDLEQINQSLSLGIQENDEDRLFHIRMEILGRLSIAQKMIRHYPSNPPENDTRPKCIQTGDYAQMGPIAQGNQDSLKIASEFWKNAKPLVHDRRERLKAKDCFSAIALVKRFAWSQYFSKRLERNPEEKRMWDTATIAAANWLKQTSDNELPLHEMIEKQLKDNNTGKHWWGNWLHQRKQKESDEECPKEAWDTIRKAREQAENMQLGAPPSYYAILALDGDRMGEKLRNASRKEQGKISQLLQQFTLEKVPEAIRKYLGSIDLGQPVYAGGDDILALLPLIMNNRGDIRNVLECAYDINKAYSNLGLGTTSAGLAIVHYKSDLRESLDAARKAEKAAKNAGRDRIGIATVRRSGEHTTAVAKWEEDVKCLSDLVREFHKGKTDRWTYELGMEMKILKECKDEGAEMIDAELLRLICRCEKAPDGIVKIWEEIITHFKNGNDLEARENALTLFQSMSFIARVKE